jgi:pheromone shutdown protein TraB
MIQAINSAKEVDAKILLADRDVNITLSRLLKTLNFRDKWRIFFSGFKIKKELGEDLDINKILSEVEKEDEDNTQINKIMNIFMREHKKIKRILIDERDLFICYHVQKVLEDPKVNTIVLVVGAGHMPGIIKNIENKNINIKELLVIKKVKLNS